MKKLSYLLFNIFVWVMVGFQLNAFASSPQGDDLREKEITELKSVVIDLLKSKNPKCEFIISETGEDYYMSNHSIRLHTLNHLKLAIEKTVIFKNFQNTVYIHLVYPQLNDNQQTALQSVDTFNNQNMTFHTGRYFDLLIPFESMIPFFSAESKLDPGYQRFLAKNAERNTEILNEKFPEMAPYFKAAMELALSKSFLESDYELAEGIFKKHLKAPKKFFVLDGSLLDDYELNVDHLNKYPDARFNLMNSKYRMGILKYDDFFEISIWTNYDKFSVFLSNDGYITGIFEGYVD